VVALRPRAVVLLAGINDLERGAEPRQVAERELALVRDLRASLPEARLVVLGLFPVGASQARLTGRVAEVNAELEPVVRQAGATWLDVGPGLADPSGSLAADNTTDGLHLSGKGYRIWTEALRPYLPP